MSDVLVIEIGADAETILRAGLLGQNTRWLKDLSPEVIAQQDASSAIFVLDGTLVVTHRVQVPDFADNKLLKVLPGILDDKIAIFGGRVHFALVGERDAEDGSCIVAITSADVMDKLQDLAEACGVTPTAVLPDYLLFDPNEDGPSVNRVAERICVRASDGTGYTAEAAQAQLMMPAEVQVDTVSIEAWQNTLANAQSQAVNLLQGSYAPGGDIFAVLKWFKRSAAFAATAFLIWAATLILQAGANSKQADFLYQDAEKLFREALPDVSRIVNIEAQMRRAVAEKSQQGGGALFSLSEKIFTAVQNQQQTMLETLRYDAEANSVVLNVSFASFADGEEFKRALQRSGADVREGSSRQEGTRVFSELTVGRAE